MSNLKGVRQRILVNKMELFNLYKEIEQIRNQENKELYHKRFRSLMKDAEFVNFTVEPKKEKACPERSRREGGNDER